MIGITDVDFIIHTQDNSEGLEALVLSIVEFYPGANISIADSSKELHRVGYKELLKTATEAGLCTRFKAHHVGYNATIASILNSMFRRTTRKYKLTLNDKMLFTKETNIGAMVELMEDEKLKAGIVNGASHEGMQGDTEATEVSVFAMHRRTIYHTFALGGESPYKALYLYLTNKTRWHCLVAAQALISSSIIKDEPNNTQQTTQISEAEKEQGGAGSGDGSPTQRNVQSNDDGKPKGSAVLPGGENEQAKNTNTSGGQSERGARPVRGQGNK